MYAKVKSVGLFGLNAFMVEVEVEISKGMPVFDVVGLGDVVVKESRERIRSAFRFCEITFPLARVMVNLAPADTKKSGAIHDLAIVTALMSSSKYINADISDCAFIGEVALNGEIRKINGVLPMTILAKKSGIRRIFVPSDNAFEASVVEGIEVYGVENIKQMAAHFMNEHLIERQARYKPSKYEFVSELDFCDVMGQTLAKKALEIAACGGHNVLLIGSPGSGKSMLSKRMPSILPKMTFNESIETTNIHSISGLVSKDAPLVTVRPFRSPHHTISPAGLAGGGSTPRPGEISLAHNGLLFLDELAEFSRQTLEILRQPLEDRKVTISRASGTVTYPCSIMLIAAMNPCPCGYYGHPTRKCTCNQKQITQYLNKVSGPVIDRFDLFVDAAPVEFDHISKRKKEESSKAIHERVQAAREIQNSRFKGTEITCNARITSNLLQELCPMTKAATEMFRGVFDKLGLSARAYDRILKVARTVADMDAVEIIDKKHIAQAVQYRSLDRKYWS